MLGDDHLLLARLIDLAEALGVEVRTVAVEPPGGSCRVRGRLVVLLSREASADEKVDVLAAAMAHHPDLDRMFLLPQVRECLERKRIDKGSGARNQTPGNPRLPN